MEERRGGREREKQFNNIEQWTLDLRDGMEKGIEQIKKVQSNRRRRQWQCQRQKCERWKSQRNGKKNEQNGGKEKEVMSAMCSKPQRLEITSK